MSFHAYLTKHDTKVRPDGPELIRLKNVCGCSAYYLYLVALGHKRLSAANAKCIADNSIGGELSADDVNVRVDVDNNNGGHKKSKKAVRRKR